MGSNVVSLAPCPKAAALRCLAFFRAVPGPNALDEIVDDLHRHGAVTVRRSDDMPLSVVRPSESGNDLHVDFVLPTTLSASGRAYVIATALARAWTELGQNPYAAPGSDGAVAQQIVELCGYAERRAPPASGVWSTAPRARISAAASPMPISRRAGGASAG
jgi:hypothetical protein